LEIPDKPGQGEGGGWFAKNRTSGKSKSPKNKYRNYSIMSNFTSAVFTCISRPFSQISRCLEILRDFSEIISENISERSPGISDSFPGIWRFVETVERYSKCPSKFINPRLKVGTARGGVPGDPGVSRRGDISGEEIILIAKHHGYALNIMN
jgi:hypothetical protein